MALESINQQYIWSKPGGHLFQVDQHSLQENLEKKVYKVAYDYNRREHYLQIANTDFSLNYKLYNLQNDFIERCLKVYKNLPGQGNMGILLNGIKGTGKTVTCKVIAKKLDMPIVMIDSALYNFSELTTFISNISEDIVVFIDEYEKIMTDQHDMLSIMDGANDSRNRRFFMFTTNKMEIEANLKQRPSRLRYIKHFGNLNEDVTSEILDDILDDKSKKDVAMEFIRRLQIITVDIVKQIAYEINMTGDLPKDFEDIFNVGLRVEDITKSEGEKEVMEGVGEGIKVSPGFSKKKK